MRFEQWFTVPVPFYGYCRCQDNISSEGGDSSTPGQCPPSATRPTEALATGGAARAKHPTIRYLRRQERSFNTLLCDEDAEKATALQRRVNLHLYGKFVCPVLERHRSCARVCDSQAFLVGA